MRSFGIVLCIFMFTALSMLASGTAHAFTLEPKKVIPQQINDLPFYGNVKKSAALTDADEKFAKTVVARMGSGEKASEFFSDRAWDAFKDARLNDAMKRANQAWLLDKKDYRAYWVMAIIQQFRGAPHDEVDGLFKKALQYVGEDEKSRLEHDHQTFLDGDKHNIAENIGQISEQYKKAAAQLTDKQGN